MRKIAMAVVAAMLASTARSVEPVSFSPAALLSRLAGGDHLESFLAVFPPGGGEFEISLPLIPRTFVYGPTGRSAYAKALKQTGPRSLTEQPGIFRIELEPVGVSAVQGLDTFASADPFAVSSGEDFVLFSGATGNDPARRCGVYAVGLPAGDLRTIIETADCRMGSPWRVLSLSPEGREALISANGRPALLDLSQGSLRPIQGQLWRGSFSPDGRWIAALQLGNPKAPSKTVLIDRRSLAIKRDLGGINDREGVWSPDSKFLLHTVFRPACPSQNPLSLETLEVETGKRSLVKDSICNCGSAYEIGWIRSDLKR